MLTFVMLARPASSPLRTPSFFLFTTICVAGGGLGPSNQIRASSRKFFRFCSSEKLPCKPFIFTSSAKRRMQAFYNEHIRKFFRFEFRFSRSSPPTARAVARTHQSASPFVLDIQLRSLRTGRFCGIPCLPHSLAWRAKPRGRERRFTSWLLARPVVSA